MTKHKKLRHLEYYDLQETFDTLYSKSKQGKVFTNLMELITCEENIRLAYRNIKCNSGSKTAGTDFRDIKDIEKISVAKLVEIIQGKLARYKPKPVKRVEIPKPNGKTRPLGIPTILDRLIQQCVLQVMEPICEAKFHERSNGFRPNRSTEHALAQCYRMIQMQKLYYVVDVDIKGFFDNVNHHKLIRQMWAMGIRDKQLICIIKQMLKAPVLMPDGTIYQPSKGTPQGGILSPLLANIVLNELDWWISSQWENMPTRHQYKTGIKANGSENHGNKYTALKKSSLKEMYIVRYADDFKIFCRNRSNADKIFYAVKHWLKDRLSLEISDEKSKVVNLKKHYSEFLGFKIKAVKKGGRYVVRSHMSDKAVKCETEKLKKQIIAIEHSGNTEEIYEQARRYNQIVVGIHNYYRYATHISEDCNKIQFIVSILMYNRLRQGLSKKGNINLKFVAEKYGDSKSMRYYCQYPIVPIGYVQTRNPMYKKRTICKYTAEGREEIHRQLKFDEITMTVLHMMSIQHISNRSIEYMDNRISVFASQHGKCAITGKPLWIDELECHHKIPLNQGGNDKYDNLVILCSDVHKLIHAVNPDIIQFYLNKIKPNKSQLRKINSLRLMAKNSVI